MAAVVAGAVLVLGAVTGCVGAPAFPDRTAIEVDEPRALFDEAIRTKITGLPPWHTVVVTATTDGPRTVWRGKATFQADGFGVVDLAEDRPLAGSYGQADAMGLFWSMRPEKDDVLWFWPPATRERPAYDVRIAVSGEGELLAERTVTRVALADGVRHRLLTVEETGLNGDLYLPEEGAPEAAPVLLLGGSEGGNSQMSTAALLASRGHPALAVCYFRCEGRPQELSEIEVEYFVKAAKFLLRQEGVRERKLVVMGGSRGSEPAQLLGQHRPELVEDVVAFASSNWVGPGYPDSSKAAWTRDGKGLPLEAIPLDDVRGTVLGVIGGDDRLWPAETLSTGIAEEHRLLVYEKAGHFVTGPPYLPEADPGHRYGGTRDANVGAKESAWQEALELVRR